MAKTEEDWPWCFFGRHLSNKGRGFQRLCKIILCDGPRSPGKNDLKETKIFEEILENFNEENREKIGKNIKLTPLPEIDDHVINYPEAGKTGCPVTISKYSEEEKIKRYPDAIGIGFAKSGTGTMASFDCHSNIVYSGWS